MKTKDNFVPDIPVKRMRRASKVVDGLKAGKTQEQMAEELRVSRQTIWADLQLLPQRFPDTTSADFEEYRKRQLKVLEMIEQNIVEGKIPPDVAREWRSVRSDISK